MAQYLPPEDLRVGNGTETVFGFTFPYLQVKDIAITVDGVDTPVVLVGTAQVSINPAPADGAKIRIFRDTPAQFPQYLFAGGIPMLPRYIDDNNRQLLYALQEGMTEFGHAVDVADAAAALAAEAKAQSSEAVVIAQSAVTTVDQSLARVVRAPLTDPTMLPLPSATSRANRVMGFDALGNPVAIVPESGSATELALDLANPTDPSKGAGQVGYAGSTVRQFLDRLMDSIRGAEQVGYNNSTVRQFLDNLRNPTDPSLGVALLGGAGRVVNTVAELIALPAQGMGAFALGYYAPGDGGGGAYSPKPGSTLTVNNGTVLPAAAGTGRWVLNQTSAPSLLQFGLRIGDTIDQTAAANAVFAAMQGKELYAPPGTYRIDGSLEMIGGVRVIMAKGAEFRRIRAKTNSVVPLVYLLDSFTELRGGRVISENNTPEGCVVLGHKSKTDDRNAWWWRFCDMDVEGNGNGWGWVIVSGQVTHQMNANYFGTIHNVNIKGFNFGSLLFENANAHNISNVHYWLCQDACIWLRGAYANNFSNMFFHGGAKDGVISIQLVNKSEGINTHSEQNKFIGFTCETGGLNDKAFVIDTECTGNVFIGTTNVAGGYTVGNLDNNIQLSGYGSASFVTLPGEAALKSGVLPAVTTKVTPTGQLSTGQSGAYEMSVQVYNTANPSLSRLDKILVMARNSSFAPSPVAVIGSAFAATGVAGEPTGATYTLDFTDGPTAPALAVRITSQGGVGSFTVKARMQRI